MNKSMKLNLLGVLLAVALSACGKIPDAYQGTFTDKATATQLVLGSTEGSLKIGAREIKGTASDVQYDALVESKAGIYIRPSQSNANIVEVFWLQQRKETRKQEADFVWEESEVLYTRMDTKASGKVQQFKMIHCVNGLIMIDLVTKTWEGGCPSGTTEYDFVRTSN